MEGREIAIQIKGLKKRYKLGQIGGGTLRGDLQSWWARVRGKEDPNSKIGAGKRSNGKTFMALDGIDLTIYKGEAVGIIGGNGAGKSTTLKLLSRITSPTEGSIDIYGRIASMLEVGTGFNGELTGRENVYMNGAILGMTKAEVDRKMEQIIDFSECREFIDTPVKRYSSGMYVKLAFSVAAHLDSEIMIMDEVLAVGDMSFQKKCLEKMREAANVEGRTVLYVSHNMNTIRQLCDRCVVLDKGKIIFDGEVEKAIETYMGANDTTKGVLDVSQMQKINAYRRGGVTIKTIALTGSPKGYIEVGQTLRIRMKMDVAEDFQDAYVRLLVCSSDRTPVSMCHSKTPLQLKKGEERSVEMEVNTSMLAPSRYTLSFIVYQIDEFGKDVFLDGLRDVARFDIVPTPGFNQNAEWHNRYWGYTLIPPFTMDDLPQ